MTTDIHLVKLFRRGRNQLVRIPRGFELPGNEAILRREGNHLIIEPLAATPLRLLLAQWAPMDNDWRPVDNLPPEDVHL